MEASHRASGASASTAAAALGSLPMQVLALSKALQKSNASLRACHVSLREALEANGGTKENDENDARGDGREGPRRGKAIGVGGYKEGARRAAALVRRGEDVRRELDLLRDDAMRMRSVIAEEVAGVSAAIVERLHASGEERARCDAVARRERDGVFGRWRASVKEQRRLMEQLCSLRGAIRVVCRLRPELRRDVDGEIIIHDADLNAAGGDDEGGWKRSATVAIGIDDDEASVSVSQHDRNFGFDGVLGPTASNDDVFAEVEAIVAGVVDGHRASIMAYGQTGAGKTFTMFGKDSRASSRRSSGGGSSVGGNVADDETDLGIIGRSLRLLYDAARDREHNEGYQYNITITALEVYNDNVIDLLAAAGSVVGVGDELHDQGWGHHHSRRSLRHRLDVRCDSATNSFFAEGVTEARPNSCDDALTTVRKAIATRRTACTSSNDLSSRSHCVIDIAVDAVGPLGWKGDERARRKLRGRLALVDLAGSERLDRSGAVGDMQLEAISINKSLTSLSDVMVALQQQSSSSVSTSAHGAGGGQCSDSAARKTHVPYRNSSLTKLLSTTLCRNSRCVLVVNVSSAHADVRESLCSLSFGERARNVCLGKAKRTTSAAAAAGASTGTPGSNKKKGSAAIH